MTEVLAVVAVTPPGSDVTVYSVIGLPPSEVGAVHETAAETSLGIAATPLGTPGRTATATEVPSVVEVTCVPAIPPVSLKSIEKLIAPLGSPEDRSNAAVQIE